MSRKSRAKRPSSFRCFNLSSEVIRLVVMMYVECPLSLRSLQDLLAERGIDVCYETLRFWWSRFGPMFPSKTRDNTAALGFMKRIMAGISHCRIGNVLIATSATPRGRDYLGDLLDDRRIEFMKDS